MLYIKIKTHYRKENNEEVALKEADSKEFKHISFWDINFSKQLSSIHMIDRKNFTLFLLYQW